MSSRKQDPRGSEPLVDASEPSLRPLEALKIDLAELEEGVHELAVELPQVWVAETLAETDAIARAGGAARLQLTYQSDRTLLVRGRIELSFGVPCARCLEPANVDVGAETGELCVTYVPADRLRTWPDVPGGSDADDDDLEPLDPSELDEIGYQGSIIDLRALISEQIVLAYPMRVLCGRGEACLGLCMRCGAELNEAVAAGSRPERCPQCNARLDGGEDEVAETPWKRALSKLERPKN